MSRRSASSASILDHSSESAEASVELQFECAVKVIRGLPKEGPYVPSHELQLKFYSYFKQATVGPCTGSRPKIWDPVNRAKWDAWNRLGKMSRHDAMKAYVKELLAFFRPSQIVETMSFTDNVAEFLSSMGPLADMIDLAKVIGEDAAREHRNKDRTAPPVPASIHEPAEIPAQSAASSVASLKSSSDAFFSPEEGLQTEDGDGWSTPPPFEDSSSDNGREGPGGDGSAKHLVSRSRPPAKTRRPLAPKPCGCKEALEQMRLDFAELSKRMKSVETSLLTVRSTPTQLSQNITLEVPDVRENRPPSNRSPSAILLFRIRFAVRALRKACMSKPNYIFVFLWPILLHVIVILAVRFYVQKFYFGA